MERPQRRSITLKALLRRYLGRRVSPQDEQGISTWYDSLEDRDYAVFASAADQERIRTAIIDEVHRRTYPVRRPLRWVAAAAVAALVVCSGLYYYYQVLSDGRNTYTIVRAENGVHKRVQLADGSTAILNAATTLLIPSDYNQRERQLVLRGEASFNVKTDASRPFKVQSGALQTTVLGTTFNVKAYPGQEMQYITVNSGAVQVRRGDGGTALSSYVLHAHEGLRYLAAQQQVQLEAIAGDAAADWQSGVLNFHNIRSRIWCMSCNGSLTFLCN
ncbi:FecR family protein [Chitinophaga sp. MD30]|uniref:FecR family protein n=1 Tax=Chitinophaga sp. MD30 TaxID=2033437 RepID=UPI000BAF3C41|nr:FecR domain-containing protein [Chitinophaga sp. MD30]ASZ11849.1 hypothetical protein CK934_13225 [Chitinophaga sp. MD30]